MHVVTFYSFKGGVGRSLALLNVAAELTKVGKKVLLVDFDLEAPGIESHFDEAPGENKGLLDFFWEYVKGFESNNARVPDIKKFVHRYSLKHADEVTYFDVMPAGKQDDGYTQRLANLDFQDLYDNRQGYLLLEDLRLQWEQVFAPDYVLIDSRTGHTDVGGICTRQLPNAMVAMAFPNAQNRDGLVKVINNVREKSERSTYIHLVISRIPRADDEELILDGMLQTFSGRSHIPVNRQIRIHHYESMDLVGQKVFTLTRPRTQLAIEYRNLTWSIRGENIEDRDGVKLKLTGPGFIKDGSENTYQIPDPIVVQFPNDEYISSVMDKYFDDGEISYFLGTFLKNHRQNYEDALENLKRAEKLGYLKALPKIAELELINGQLVDAGDAAKRALQELDLNDQELRVCVRTLIAAEKDPIEIVNSFRHEALTSSQINIIEQHFTGSINADKILRTWFSKRAHFTRRDNNTQDLIECDESEIEVSANSEENNERLLGLIIAGMYREAINLGRLLLDRKEDDLQNLFNFSMASWALDGSPNRKLFGKLKFPKDVRNPNMLLCEAITIWIMGDSNLAENKIRNLLLILRSNKRTMRNIFSPWSYKSLPKQLFLRDIAAIRRQIKIDPDCTSTPAPFARKE